MESRCHEDSPECRCPCGCGCQNDPEGSCLPFTQDGLCASCGDGDHEIVPEEVVPIDTLITATKSYLVQLERERERRLIDKEQE